MQEFLMSLSEFNMITVAFRLFLAMFLGAAIGYERGKRGRPAGIKTHSLVCLGAALVMLTGEFIVNTSGHTADVTRLAAQVISGIGFLGAGTILVTRRNQVRGLTTASGLWLAACLGLACGIGFYSAVIIVMICFMVVTYLFSFWDSKLIHDGRNVDLYLEYNQRKTNAELIRIVKDRHARISDLEIGSGKDENGVYFYAHVSLSCKSRSECEEIIHEVGQIEGILLIEEI